jgi:hypothetical protein
MKVELTLSTDDDEMVDEADATGLTAAAYDELMDALANAGFAIADGPRKIA